MVAAGIGAQVVGILFEKCADVGESFAMEKFRTHCPYSFSIPY